MQFRHSILYLLAHSIPALAAFLTLALYTRWISPEDYGLYSTLLVVANSANIILFNWLYVALMRYWSSNEFKEEELKGLILFVLTIGSILILICALIYFAISKNGLLAAALAGVMISNAIYTSYQRINSLSLQAERYLVIELLRVVLTTALAIGLVWLGYSWYGILFATSVGFLLIPLVSPHFWHSFRNYSKTIGSHSMLKLVKYGLPLSLSFILLEIIHTTDRVLLSWLVGFDAAGQYSVAFSLPFQLLVLVGSAINMAAYPLILQTLEKEGELAAKAKLANYLLILLGLLIPSYLGLIAVSHDFMPLLIGSVYLQESLRLLPIIGFLLVVNTIYLFHTSLSFQIAKQTYKPVLIVGLASIINIALNLALIPYYGIEGAIIASLISYLFCVVYGHNLGAKYFRLPILWIDVFKIIFSAFLMLAILKALPIGYGAAEGFLRILIGCIVYTATVSLLNVANIRIILFNFLKAVNKCNEITDYQS